MKIGWIGQLWHQDSDRLAILFLLSDRTLTQRVVIAMITVAIAFVLREMIGPASLGLPFLTFFPAAAISAFLAGFWSGMLAAALGSLLATYYSGPRKNGGFRARVVMIISPCCPVYGQGSP